MARKKTNGKQIERRALRIEQDPAHPLYLFTLTSDELLNWPAPLFE